MNQETGIESVEIERKYEVPEGAVLPEPSAFAAVGLSTTEPEEFRLIASYFDTPDRALAAHGVAVRSREGGKDAGWHLKRRGKDAVRETGWPAAPQMPSALAAEIIDLIGPEAMGSLRAVAELRTRRVIVVLSDERGNPVVELADDEVFAYDRQAESAADEVRRAWREWEAEIVGDADPAWLERIEPVLRAAGATPSPSLAKIGRATGQLVALARSKGADPELIARLEALDADDQAAARRVEA